MRFILLLFLSITFANAAPLSGNYTIGGSSPSYTTFTAAAAALESNGISGPVVFNVRNGTYTEAVYITAIPGSSATNTITFQSESGDSSQVTLTYGGSANTFWGDTLKNITLRKMTFRNTYVGINYAAIFLNNGGNIKVQNCVMRCSGSSGNGFVCSRADSAVYLQNSWAYNCANSVFIVDGIAPYTTDVRIENNIITSGNEALSLEDLGKTIVKRNYIQGGYRAFHAVGVQTTEIDHNTCRSGGGFAFGMLNCWGGSSGVIKINDNLILTTSTSQPSNIGAGMTSCYGVQFIHNTVYFNSPNTFDYACIINSSDTCFMYDNIIMNNGPGYAYQISGVNDPHSDHNVFFTNGALMAPGANSLSQWQNTRQLDSNSIYANPQFINIPNNLRPSNSLVDGQAIPWPGITDDLANVPRHPQYPDPGCYEISFTPVANLGPNQSLCGYSVLLNAGNNGSYYLWNTGATSQSIYANTSGTYWVQINNLAGTSSDTIQVTLHPYPTLSISGNDSICLGDSTQLTASSSATLFSWFPISGLDNPSSNNVFANPATTTVYTLTATSSFGCNTSANYSVAVLPLPIALAGADQSICIGSTIQIGSSSGSNCNWNPSVGLSSSSDCQPFASPASATNYELTVTDIYGCQNKDTVLVNVNSLPAISVCCDQSICTGDTTILTTSSSASNFSWSPAIGLSSPTGASVNAFPSTSTNFTVTRTDANGCVNTDTVQITVNALPAISVCCAQAICPGDTVLLIANSSATNFNWSPSAELSSSSGTSVNAFPFSATTFTVTGTDANGCINSDSVLLTVNPAPNVPVITQILADLVSSETSGNQWYLNGNPINGATNQTYTPTQNGNYTVVYTDANGCSAVSQVYFFGTVGQNGSTSNGAVCFYNADHEALTLGGIPSGNFQLTIFNTMGQLVVSDILNVSNKSELSYPINLTHGVYLVSIIGASKEISWKVVVDR